MSDQHIATNRRDLLKLSSVSAVAGLAAGSLMPRKALAQESDIRISYASWIHGHSMQIEFPDRIAFAIRRGFGFRVEGQPGTANWFHFAIPTPVIIDDVRLRVDSVMLRFATGSIDAFVRDVHVYDGDGRIAAHNDVYLVEQNAFVRFAVPDSPRMLWGLGISLGVGFGVEPMAHTIDFVAAGADFVIEPLTAPAE